MHKVIFISLFELLSPVKVYLFANNNSSIYLSHSSAASSWERFGTKSFATREVPILFEVEVVWAAVCVFSLWLVICINCNVIVIVSPALTIRSTLDSGTKPGSSHGKPTQQPSIISAQVSYHPLYDFNLKSQSIPGRTCVWGPLKPCSAGVGWWKLPTECLPISCQNSNLKHQI